MNASDVIDNTLTATIPVNRFFYSLSKVVDVIPAGQYIGKVYGWRIAPDGRLVYQLWEKKINPDSGFLEPLFVFDLAAMKYTPSDEPGDLNTTYVPPYADPNGPLAPTSAWDIFSPLVPQSVKDGTTPGVFDGLTKAIASIGGMGLLIVGGLIVYNLTKKK